MPPTFTITSSGLILAPGATSGNTTTIRIFPNGGFTGSVTLTPAITSAPYAAQHVPTFSFGSTSPANITGAAAATATLTITTTAPTSAGLARPQRPGVRWYATAGAALACLLLFGIPARRRGWRNMLGLLALLVAVAGGVLACGGGGSGSGGGGGGGGNTGTTSGPYTITVTGTSGTIMATGTVTLMVQ